jgi:hypothetical protein
VVASSVAEQDRTKAVPAVLDQPADDQAALGDEQPAPVREFRICNPRILGNSGVIGHDRHAELGYHYRLYEP